MKLYCYSDKAFSILYDAAKSQRDDIVANYSKDEPWSIQYIMEHGGDEDNFYPVNNVSFDVDLICDDRGYANDTENSIRLYSSLKTLPPSHAANPKLWTYLCHESLYKYMVSRWKNFTLERYFVDGGGASALYRNGLARLWWCSYMTYDESRKDPFELTRVLLRRQDDMENIFGRDLNLNKKTLKCLLETLLPLHTSEYNTEILRSMMKDINRVGGVSILDALPEEKLLNLFRRKYEEHSKKYR